MTTRVGIRDVAKAAGVSVTTVSHALNDATSFRVKAATQQLVREVARDLGYAPNKMASGLRNQRSQILGLVSDEITTTPFAGAMIRGAQDAAYDRGYVVMVVNSGLDSELETREINMLRQHQVDGVVYARMYHQSVQVPQNWRAFPPCCWIPSLATGPSPRLPPTRWAPPRRPLKQSSRRATPGSG